MVIHTTSGININVRYDENLFDKIIEARTATDLADTFIYLVGQDSTEFTIDANHIIAIEN